MMIQFTYYGVISQQFLSPSMKKAHAKCQMKGTTKKEKKNINKLEKIFNCVPTSFFLSKTETKFSVVPSICNCRIANYFLFLPLYSTSWMFLIAKFRYFSLIFILNFIVLTGVHAFLSTLCDCFTGYCSIVIIVKKKIFLLFCFSLELYSLLRLIYVSYSRNHKCFG